MCGIVGYIGNEEALPVLLQGMKQLEYRGYDSAGVAVLGSGGLKVVKTMGALKFLEAKLKNLSGVGGGETDTPVLSGKMGIGHTRWATHGEPSDINSHPHTDYKEKIAVIHNGIIENHAQLHEKLEKLGVKFKSETDTEVIAHLIQHFYSNGETKGDLVASVLAVTRSLEGSFALGIVCDDDRERIIGVRKESPLVVALGDGEALFASDVPALLPYARDVYYLDDGEITVLYRDHIDFFNMNGERIEKSTTHIDWDTESARKDGYEHFMLKEMHEEPTALRNTIRARVKDSHNGKIIDVSDVFPAIGTTVFPMGTTAGIGAGVFGDIFSGGRIIIAGCGTAFYAATVGKYAFEKFARVNVEAVIASEFRYSNPVINKNDIMIIISQSGETADTLAAFRLAKSHGLKTIAITNVIGSTLSREADFVMNTVAGPEIAVASTKAFTTQLACIYLLALAHGHHRKTLSNDEYALYIDELLKIPDSAQKILDAKGAIQKFASKTFNKTKVFFLGRLFDYAVSLEGALKLKEISYTHSESFSAGELKHGPIALVDKSTLAFAICTQDELFGKMESNIREVKARGADTAVITYEDVHIFDNIAEAVFRIPRTENALSPILSVIPAQLYAYYCSVLRGLDPDKPRNLAKSVTVE